MNKNIEIRIEKEFKQNGVSVYFHSLVEWVICCEARSLRSIFVSIGKQI